MIEEAGASRCLRHSDSTRAPEIISSRPERPRWDLALAWQIGSYMAKESKPEPTRMENTAGEQEIWSAIQYLDPDQGDKAGSLSARVPALALLAVIFMIWLLLHLLLRRL